MEKKVRMLTARKFAQEIGVDYSTVVRWLKNDLVPGAERKESEDRGAWWEIPETSLKMEKPRPGPKSKKQAGEVSTATDSPDDGAPPAAIGERRPAKPAKKASSKGSKRSRTR